MFQQRHHHGVACFVIGNHAPLFVAEHPALACRPGHHPFNRLHQFVHANGALVAAGGQYRRLIEQVLQVGAHHAGRLLGDHVQIYIRSERFAARMHVQDRLASAAVRPVHHDRAVESARSQQSRVENIRAIGRSDDDHGCIAIEAVHLDQNLIERLLSFIVAAAHAGAAMTADRVDFIDKDDTGSVLLCLFEQIAHAAGAHAHEHFHEFGAADAEEGRTGFTGYRFGQQSLAGTRRSDHQHPFGDARAQGRELFRLLQELDHLLQLLFGLI